MCSTHIMGRSLNENLLSSREHLQQKTINYREMTGRRKVVLGLQGQQTIGR